jgi:cytochrome P450
VPVSATTLPREIPGPSLPAALSAFLRAGNACDFVLAMTKRYGAIWRVPGAPPLIVLGMEAHFQDVLVRNQRKFGKDRTLRPMELLCSKSILYPSPEARRKYQALFTPPLSPRDVREHQDRLAGLIETACATLDRRFLDRAGVELEGVLLDLHFRVMMSFYFGYAVDAPIGMIGERVLWLARSLPLVWNTRFLPTPRGIRARRAIRELRAQVTALVAERCTLARRDDGSFDVAGACDVVSPTEMAEHLLVLLFASVNIPVAMTNALYCIATHPGVASDIEDELASGAPGQAAIRAALEESLRLYPVSSMILRDTLEDHVADGIAIRRGTVVVLPTVVLNRSAARWEDPQAFRPRRFEGAGPRPDHYPYGLGPRYCIGAGYSQATMPLLLDRFLRSFRMELVSAVPRISHSLPLSLRSVRVRLTARTS